MTKNQLRRSLQALERYVAQRRVRAQEAQERITKKMASLIRQASQGSEQDRISLRRKIAELETKTADLSLEQVEEEVDKIYGDQSQNSTYYFKRRQRLASEELDWTQMSLEEAEEIIDGIYGDQSRNETFYFSRNASNRSLREVEEEVEAIYGDQSDNATWYFDRRRESYNVAPDQYRLKDPEDPYDDVAMHANSELPGNIWEGVQDTGRNPHVQDVRPELYDRNFDEYRNVGADKNDGYFDQGDFADWPQDQTDIGPFNADPFVSDERDRWTYTPEVTPHIVEDRDKAIGILRSASDMALRPQVQEWMRSVYHQRDWSLEDLAEAASIEFDHEYWIEDPDHWVFEVALDVMDGL